MSARDGDVDFRSMRPVTSIIRARNPSPEWRIEPRCNVCRLHEAPLLNAASVLSQVEEGLVHFVPVLQILEGIGPLMTTWPQGSTIKKDSLYGHRDHMGIPGRVRRGVDEGAERMGYDLDKMEDSVATTLGALRAVIIKGLADLQDGNMEVTIGALLKALDMDFALQGIVRGKSVNRSWKAQREMFAQILEKYVPRSQWAAFHEDVRRAEGGQPAGPASTVEVRAPEPEQVEAVPSGHLKAWWGGEASSPLETEEGE
jgi:hypothetical protein